MIGAGRRTDEGNARHRDAPDATLCEWSLVDTAGPRSRPTRSLPVFRMNHNADHQLPNDRADPTLFVIDEPWHPSAPPDLARDSKEIRRPRSVGNLVEWGVPPQHRAPSRRPPVALPWPSGIDPPRGQIVGRTRNRSVHQRPQRTRRVSALRHQDRAERRTGQEMRTRCCQRPATVRPGSTQASLKYLAARVEEVLSRTPTPMDSGMREEHFPAAREIPDSGYPRVNIAEFHVKHWPADTGSLP